MGDRASGDLASLLGDLSATERRIWEAFAAGEMVDLRVGDPGRDDPARAESWDASRRVRGEVLAALLLGALPPIPGRVAVLRLAGANIVGQLSAAYGVVRFPLEFTGCAITNPIELGAAALAAVVLADCVLPGLSASSATIDGDLYLGGCRSSGEIRLLAAHIKGTTAYIQRAPEQFGWPSVEP